MSKLLSLVQRNTKVFFKDKGMFFTSLITPLILLLLFVTFLGNVYRDSFAMCAPKGIDVPDTIVDGFVGGWLFSSLLAVCCVTVAFCSNMLMVQDKVTGARTDLTMAPVRKSTLAFGYYISTALTTLIICAVALVACIIYLSRTGWYLSGQDILLVCLDVFLLTMFGTALSSVVNSFLSTQGQISAVGTIVSAAYGFICGAYMPISQFSEGIQTFISFLPGTYGTALLHNHLMGGVMQEMKDSYFPSKVVEQMKDSFDSNLYFFDHKVSIPQMYAVLVGAVVLLIGVYILLNVLRGRKKK
ncbi:MAG: ABC transporter permease [Ruminococcus sp.]